jgi:hypothetical protein
LQHAASEREVLGLFVHRELAVALVNAGSAAVVAGNGRFKAVKLPRPASFCAERIGDATDRWIGAPFSVRNGSTAAR